MSSKNKITFRVIGLFALITGIVYFSSNILELGRFTTVKDFIAQFTSSVINCVAIYGGYQLLKIKEMGRKLLLVWLGCQAPIAILVILTWVYSAVFSRDFEISTIPQMPMPVAITFYLLCILILIYLLANRISQEGIIEDHRHLYLLATMLSFLAPGLGRAVAGNLLWGIIWFYLYSLLMIGTTISLVTYPEYMNWITRFLYYLVVWRILSAIDWSAVKSFEESSQRKIDLAADLTPEQVKGG